MSFTQGSTLYTRDIASCQICTDTFFYISPLTKLAVLQTPHTILLLFPDLKVKALDSRARFELSPAYSYPSPVVPPAWTFHGRSRVRPEATLPDVRLLYSSESRACVWRPAIWTSLRCEAPPGKAQPTMGPDEGSKLRPGERRQDQGRPFPVGYAQILAGSHAFGPDASTSPNTRALCLDITELYRPGSTGKGVRVSPNYKPLPVKFSGFRAGVKSNCRDPRVGENQFPMEQVAPQRVLYLIGVGSCCSNTTMTVSDLGLHQFPWLLPFFLLHF
eukprot:g35368.t1